MAMSVCLLREDGASMQAPVEGDHQQPAQHHRLHIWALEIQVSLRRRPSSTTDYPKRPPWKREKLPPSRPLIYSHMCSKITTDQISRSIANCQNASAVIADLHLPRPHLDLTEGLLNDRIAYLFHLFDVVSLQEHCWQPLQGFESWLTLDLRYFWGLWWLWGVDYLFFCFFWWSLKLIVGRGEKSTRRSIWRFIFGRYTEADAVTIQLLLVFDVHQNMVANLNLNLWD